MSINVIQKTKNEVLFWQYWQELITTNYISPRYLKTNIETYCLALKNDSCFYEDASFVYIIDNKPVAGVFLPIEKREGDLTISYRGDFANAPIFAAGIAKKAVYKLIDEIAEGKKIAKIMFAVDPLENENYNYLQEFDYLDASILAYIINLKSDDLLKSCRKGHRCDIKKILNDKKFKVIVVDQKNSDYEIHEKYRELHYKCSGRTTRSNETFDLQFEDVKNGNAVLFGIQYENKHIAFAYFKYNFDKAIYASGADDPDYNNFPLYHTLVYSAMEYLKRIGVHCINTGQPSSPSRQILYYPDLKQLNIALFKRGFCGQYKNFNRGIKYFSHQLFKKEMNEFINNYKK